MDVDLLMGRAREAFGRGDDSTALDLFAKCMELRPGDETVFAAFYRHAKQRFANPARRSGTLVRALKGAATMIVASLLRPLAPGKAFRAACKGLWDSPSSPVLLGLVGRCASSTDLLQFAAFAFESSIKARRRPSARDLRMVARIYKRMEKYPKAIERFQQLQQLKPEDREAKEEVHGLSALATIQGGRYDATEEGDFRRSLRDADAQRDLQDEGTIARHVDQIQAAIERLNRAIEAEPSRSADSLSDTRSGMPCMTSR